jgi:hypothetical protein
MERCPWKAKFEKFMANYLSVKSNVGINGVVIEELKGANVNVALIQVQRAKSKILVIIDDLLEKELRKLNTKKDWENEEAIQNSILDAIQNINK